MSKSVQLTILASVITWHRFCSLLHWKDTTVMPKHTRILNRKIGHFQSEIYTCILQGKFASEYTTKDLVWNLYSFLWIYKKYISQERILYRNSNENLYYSSHNIVRWSEYLVSHWNSHHTQQWRLPSEQEKWNLNFNLLCPRTHLGPALDSEAPVLERLSRPVNAFMIMPINHF